MMIRGWRSVDKGVYVGMRLFVWLVMCVSSYTFLFASAYVCMGVNKALSVEFLLIDIAG